MKTKKNWIITITFLAFVIAFAQVTQVAGKSEQRAKITPQTKYTIEPREVLAGLQGVHVVVEDFKPEVEKYGFNREQYQTDAELRLRQNGIRVLSEEEQLLLADKTFLHIIVTPVILENGLSAAVGISVEFKEPVLLHRNPSIITFAITWDKGTILNVGLLRFNEIRGHVRDLVDQFINDYLAANPKDQPSKKDSTTKTIQQTYVVPKNALIDMSVCATFFQIASDPNLPQELQELKAVARKRGIELYAIHTLHLEQLGIKAEDIKARLNFLNRGDLEDMPAAEVIGYINFEDDKKMFP